MVKFQQKSISEIAKISSSQNNSLLMELAYSDAPEELAEKLHKSYRLTQII